MSPAELLLYTTDRICIPKSRLIVAGGWEDGQTFALVKLARDFKRINPGLQLRAIVERWTPQQIVQQVY